MPPDPTPAPATLTPPGPKPAWVRSEDWLDDHPVCKGLTFAGCGSGLVLGWVAGAFLGSYCRERPGSPGATVPGSPLGP